MQINVHAQMFQVIKANSFFPSSYEFNVSIAFFKKQSSNFERIPVENCSISINRFLHQVWLSDHSVVVPRTFLVRVNGLESVHLVR